MIRTMRYYMNSKCMRLRIQTYSLQIFTTVFDDEDDDNNDCNNVDD